MANFGLGDTDDGEPDKDEREDSGDAMTRDPPGEKSGGYMSALAIGLGTGCAEGCCCWQEFVSQLAQAFASSSSCRSEDLVFRAMAPSLPVADVEDRAGSTLHWPEAGSLMMKPCGRPNGAGVGDSAAARILASRLGSFGSVCANAFSTTCALSPFTGVRGREPVPVRAARAATTLVSLLWLLRSPPTSGKGRDVIGSAGTG